MSDKIIVTSKKQLMKKYGNITTAIYWALRNMITAERNQGIQTKIANLDVSADP